MTAVKNLFITAVLVPCFRSTDGRRSESFNYITRISMSVVKGW